MQTAEGTVVKFRFFIRDLLWLTLVVALVVGWWIDHWANYRPYYLTVSEDGSLMVHDDIGGTTRRVERGSVWNPAPRTYH
jgi:hypothetical protein